MELDEALGRLGDWGRWQVIYFTMLSTACMFPSSWHMLAIVFIGETFANEANPFDIVTVFCASISYEIVSLS